MWRYVSIIKQHLHLVTTVNFWLPPPQLQARSLIIIIRTLKSWQSQQLNGGIWLQIVCLVTEMTPFSFYGSGWQSWCDANFLFQLLHCSPSSVFPSISLVPPSHFLSFFLAFYFSHSLSLTLGTTPLSDHLGLSNMCECLCVSCPCAYADVWARVLLKRPYMYVFVHFSLCVSRRVFLRQVDSCYLVAMQLSPQCQGR